MKKARKNKVQTTAKTKLKGNFKNARLHSDKITDYRAGSFPSIVAKPDSPFQENKADIELKKLVSNDKVFPKGKTPETNKKRYSWAKSRSGRQS